MGREVRRRALPDRVCAADDHAPRRLAEDVGELGHRHDLVLDELRERLARADRGELVGVADEHDVLLVADGAQERDEQLQIRHRGLVDDQHVGLDLVLGRALARDPAQSGVDRRRLHAGRFGHPARGAAGRRDEDDRRLLVLGGGADHADRGRLAGARAAGDDRQPRGEGGLDRGGLLGCGNEVLARVQPGGLQERLAPQQRVDRQRQLLLERRGRRAIGPQRPVGVLLEDDLAVVGHVLQQRGVRGRAVEDRLRLLHELRDRQARRAVALGLAQAHGPRRRGDGPAPPARSPRRARSCPRSGTRRRTRSSARTAAYAPPRARARRTRWRSAAPATRARAARAAGAGRASSAARSRTSSPPWPAGD